MNENIKVRWLTDNEQTKIAPKTLSSQVFNEDGSLYKDTVDASIRSLDETKASKEYVENLYQKLSSNTVLGFYCIEDVAVVTNGISKVKALSQSPSGQFAITKHSISTGNTWYAKAYMIYLKDGVSSIIYSDVASAKLN